MVVQLFHRYLWNKWYQQLHIILKNFLALHEVNWECIWLWSLIQHTQKTCGLPSRKINTTIIYEDNMHASFNWKMIIIKRDRTKHISPKFVFTHDLEKNGDINIWWLCSCDNLLDLFLKSLPNRNFSQLVWNISIHHQRNDHLTEEEKWIYRKRILYSFSFTRFFPTKFFIVRF